MIQNTRERPSLCVTSTELRPTGPAARGHYHFLLLGLRCLSTCWSSKLPLHLCTDAESASGHAQRSWTYIQDSSADLRVNIQKRAVGLWLELTRLDTVTNEGSSRLCTARSSPSFTSGFPGTAWYGYESYVFWAPAMCQSVTRSFSLVRIMVTLRCRCYCFHLYRGKKQTER